VAGIARIGNAGEVLATGHGAPLCGPSSPARCHRHPRRSNLGRSSLIGRPAEADTPSRGIFAKEPLSSLDFEPAVQSVFQRIRFLFWKMYFSFSRFKIKFQIFTELPLISNAYKMLILTPI